APLRRECVLSCVNLLLSDCFHAIPQETGTRSFLGGRIHRATCRPRRLFLTGINNSTEHATIHSAKALMNTRGVGPEPDYRSALTGSLHRRQNSSPVAVAAATRRRRKSDTTTMMASHGERNSNPVFSPEPDVAVTCDRHTGRSHINTLREVLHRLVEVAVCDPEESIRHVALKNLTVETDQFLCTDAAILDLLFAAFNDAYLPNRLEVVRILRRIAQCTYSVVYPRLRKLFLQMLRHFQDRIFLSYSQHEGKVNTTVN
ncbi:phosphotransferase, partial [Trypanosoma cruzi]